MRESFRSASKAALAQLLPALDPSIVAVVGYLDQSSTGRTTKQSCHCPRIKGVATYTKRHLPNYGVFDEFRNFVPGDSSLVIRVKGVDIGIAICEDIWHSLADLAARTPGLVLVPNGSPYERNKDDVRLALVQKRAKEVGAPLAYVNMTGGQDDLVFDGDTIVVDAKGSVISRAAQFEDQLLVVDIETATHTSKPDVVISENGAEAAGSVAPAIAERMSDHQEIWNALVMGLRDYVAKNKFRSVVVGLSGGIDSALVAAIAVDALGAKCVNGVAMPSKYSSDHSVEDATAFAANTGIHFRTVAIEPMVQSFMDSITLKGLAAENIQARVRGTTLMGISNQEGHLVLATGNKSELAVGYSTLYGDAVGGFAPIKIFIKQMSGHLLDGEMKQAISRGQAAPIPVRSIEKEPSAELRPDQKDSDSLPEYELLDQLLTRYVDGDEGSAALIAAGFDSALVMRVIGLVDKAEYKRRQYPPGTKVSARAFGKDRRLPMTSRWSEA